MHAIRTLITSLPLFVHLAMVAPTDARSQTLPPAPATAESSTAQTARAEGEAEIKQMIADLKALSAAGKSRETEHLARRTVARAEALFGPKDGYVGVTSANLGRLLRNADRAVEAAPWMLKALEIASGYFSIGDKPYKDAVAELVETLIAAKDLNTAARLFDRIIAGASAAPDLGLTLAHYHFEYGAMLRRLGRFPDAQAQFKASLALREKLLPAGKFEIVSAMIQLAGIMRVTGQFTDAEKQYVRALEVLQQAGDTSSANVGIILDNLGVVYNELGRLADAERVERQALAIFEATLGPEHLTTAQGAANLAALFYKQDRHPEALAMFERASVIYRKRLKPNDPRLGVLLDNLGGLYRELGRIEDARSTMREALASLSATYPDSHPEVAIALANLAGAESDLRNDVIAEGLYRRALAAHTVSFGADSHYVGEVYKGLAEIQSRRGQTDEAQENYRRAVAIVEATLGPEHPAQEFALRQLAQFAVRARQFEPALTYSRRAVKIEVANRARRRLDQSVLNERRRNDAPFVSALDVVWHAREGSRPNDTALEAEAFELAQRITLSTAGRSLDQLGSRLGAGNRALGELVRDRQDLTREWAALDARIVRSVGSAPDRRDAAAEAVLRSQIASNEQRTAALDRRLAEEFPAFAAISQPKPLDLPTARLLLKPNETLLQYVPGPTHTYLWAVSASQSIWLKLEIGEAEMARRVDILRCGLDPEAWHGEAGLKCLNLVGRTPDGQILPFDGATAHALYRDLVMPVATQIQGRTILLVTTGALAGLPFQVLLTEPSPTTTSSELAAAPWLLKGNPIAILPGVASLSTLRQQSAPSRATRPYFGVANPILVGSDGADTRALQRLTCPAPRPAVAKSNVALDRSPPQLKTLVRSGKVDASMVRTMPPLPETTDEICAVARGLGADLEQDLLIGPDASKSRIVAANENRKLASYRIVHFATHGLVGGEIAGLTEPALVLSPPVAPSDDDNGLLTASDVAVLRLDADVVVLSACNTASGQGEDKQALSGLARAFFYAGARSLIVSHWPVNSDAAVKLVTGSFEATALDRRGGRAKALQVAMTRMLGDPTRPEQAHPQMWAPFILVGEDGAEVEAPLAAPVRSVSRSQKAGRSSAGRGARAIGKANSASRDGGFPDDVFSRSR